MYKVKKDIPNAFYVACGNSESFASLLNFRLDIIRQNIIYENKVAETKMLMGQQMIAVSDSINRVTDELVNEVVFNKEGEALVNEALSSVGIKLTDVLFLEKEGKLKSLELYTKYCNKDKNVEKLILRTLQNALQTKLTIKNHYCSAVGCYFTIRPKQKFGILSGTAICAKGDVSGDVHSFMQLENGKYLMAVAMVATVFQMILKKINAKKWSDFPPTDDIHLIFTHLCRGGGEAAYIKLYLKG